MADNNDVTLALREVQRAVLEIRQELARRLHVGVNDVAALDQLVFATEPLGPVELGNRLGMRSASATALADRLEQAGHVRRQPHPTDRRRQTLAPTDHAIAEVVAALRPLIDRLNAAAAELSPDQATATAAFLRQAAGIMREYASGRDVTGQDGTGRDGSGRDATGRGDDTTRTAVRRSP
ncbi:MAG TPA: MarR family transcriptional regulator [Streptosporangiaceae bacterium]